MPDGTRRKFLQQLAAVPVLPLVERHLDGGTAPIPAACAPAVAQRLSPEMVLAELKRHQVSHVVWLPDSETSGLYSLMKAEPSLTLVGIAREGNAFSTAAGLASGGKKPLVLIQDTGLMESGDSMRGWVLGLGIPVVLIIGYRGWTRHGVTPDSAAVYIERVLNAFGVTYYLVETDADASRFGVAFEEAKRTNRPVAVLIGQEFHEVAPHR